MGASEWAPGLVAVCGAAAIGLTLYWHTQRLAKVTRIAIGVHAQQERGLERKGLWAKTTTGGHSAH